MTPWTIKQRPYFAAAFGIAALGAAAFGASSHVKKAQENVKPGQNITLAGQISGACGPQGAQDKPRDFNLSGRGDVSPLGQVSAAVTLTAPHGDPKTHSSGAIALTGPHGSIKATLASSERFGFTGKAIRATFRITGGTGDYSGATGAGDAEITLNPQYRPPHVPGRPTPMFIRAAMFKIEFHGSHL